MAARCNTLPVIAAALALAGCDHLARRETVSAHAGDAKAANAAIHTIDPWPRHAENNRIGMDGVKAQQAMEKYYRPPRGNQSPQPTPIVVAPSPAPADGQRQD
jgi:hypothetical protein